MRWLLFVFFLIPSLIMAAERAFAPTSPGTVEIKVLPAGRLLESRGTGSYFERSNNLFGPLFRYISRNDIAMTTPVEARIEPGAMYFWVAGDQVEKAARDEDGVRVLDVPRRTVAAIGARGGYSEDNFEKAKAELLDWIADKPFIKPTGEPFAVYWDGPMTPWFMKTFEVMVEVEVRG